MFPLCRQAPVTRRDCPAVGFREFGVVRACIEHWLNRECHAFFQYKSCAWLAEMQHLRIFMKYSADTVTTVLAYN